jgi:hypothetical protein
MGIFFHEQLYRTDTMILIVDVFDNSISRQVVKDYADRTGTLCLHAGLSADYAEVMWNSPGFTRSPHRTNHSPISNVGGY